MKFIVIAIVFALGLCTATAQQSAPAVPEKAEVTFAGQVRYRGEIDGRFFDMNSRPLWIHLLRAQFTAKAALGSDVTSQITLQHSQNFGEGTEAAWNGSLDGVAKNFTLRHAWIQWNNALTRDLSLKIGRMSFALNSERLIGALDWHNVGRLYDGAVLTYGAVGATTVRAFGFVPGSNELLMTSGLPQSPQGLYGADITLPSVPLNLYCYHDRKNAHISGRAAFLNDTSTFRRFTAGAFSQKYFKDDSFEYEAEFAWQFGDRDPGQTIGAMMAAVYAGYKSQEFSAGVGFDYFTGNDAATADKYERFNHLYFTIHKFYGYMDFFPFAVLPNNNARQAPAQIANAGLVSPWVRGNYKTGEKSSVMLTAMMMRSEQALTVNGGDAGNNLGIELDAVADFALHTGLTAQIGASVFLPGQTLKDVNTANPARNLGTDPAYWAYSTLMYAF